MRIEDIFEKRERAIYQLIALLQEQPANHFVKDLADQLGLSRTTLLRYIESFQQDAEEQGLGISLYVQGEQVFYRRAPQLSQQTYLRFFAGSSLKFQILSYIFDKEEFTIQKLSQQLLISEASLNRQLSALNQLLDEFGLSIRNGRLKGSELQVRHFYFLLFWNLGGTAQDNLGQAMAYQTKNLTVFERLYADHFQPKQADQLLLWMTIGQRRMRLPGLDFEELYARMAPYKEHKFYDRLRQVALTLYDQTAGGTKEGEAMCLFIFLFFRFILGAPQVEQMLAFGGPIKEATTLGLSYLREVTPKRLVLNEEAMYHLNQLLGQIYFFKGDILVDQAYASVLGNSPRFKKLAKDVFHQVSEQVYGHAEQERGDFVESICRSFEQLFHYLTLEAPSHLWIGVSLSGDKVVTRPLLAHLQKELERNRYISIEDWQADKSYDLIITDYRQFEKQATYTVGSSLTRGDILALKNLIKELSQA